ncbi:hypothetical protein F4819DRAFT_87311 [Hypoxylon fuscum]|nr:hypothetical protein F4819DRAFT_87311 [Hypoxylon fuscum]
MQLTTLMLSALASATAISAASIPRLPRDEICWDVPTYTDQFFHLEKDAATGQVSSQKTSFDVGHNQVGLCTLVVRIDPKSQGLKVSGEGLVDVLKDGKSVGSFTVDREKGAYGVVNSFPCADGAFEFELKLAGPDEAGSLEWMQNDNTGLFMQFGTCTFDFSKYKQMDGNANGFRFEADMGWES